MIYGLFQKFLSSIHHILWQWNEMTNNAFKKWVSNFRDTLNFKFFFFSGALFEYSVILLRMKIKTIRQIRKCLNGNLAAYLAPLANPLGSNVANGGISRPTQGYQGREIRHFFHFHHNFFLQEERIFLPSTLPQRWIWYFCAVFLVFSWYFQSFM